MADIMVRELKGLHLHDSAEVSSADDILARELTTLHMDDSAKTFSPELLRVIRARPHVVLQGIEAPREVFVSIDPGCGGSSHYAITSCFYVTSICVVSVFVSPLCDVRIVYYPSSTLVLACASAMARRSASISSAAVCGCTWPSLSNTGAV